MSDNDHLANLSDGAGCAEVWEHLSEQRDADSEADEEAAADSDSVDAETADTAEDADAEQEAALEVPCP